MGSISYLLYDDGLREKTEVLNPSPYFKEKSVKKIPPYPLTWININPKFKVHINDKKCILRHFLNKN